jgi:hypothetical protein
LLSSGFFFTESGHGAGEDIRDTRKAIAQARSAKVLV